MKETAKDALRWFLQAKDDYESVLYSNKISKRVARGFAFSDLH